jgi:uncharacterized protein (DUF2062 family)
MPRRFFRKYLPTAEQVRAQRWLRGRGRWLHHPNLWALNRDSVAGAVAIGLFAGLVPGPLQMLAAALLAIPLKKNLPVALLTTFYTNPLTIVPLYLLALAYGKLLLGVSNHPTRIVPYEWDWAHWIDSMTALGHWLVSLGPPLAVGLVALALTLAALGYAAVQIGWRLHVALAWRRRQKMRAAKSAK